MKPTILAMEPFKKTVVWGSRALESYGKGPAEHLGESWEISCVEGGLSKDAASGRPLRDFFLEDPEHFLGSESALRSFPWLIKLLATADWLSLQVHPSDQQALDLVGRPLGKRECWLILEATEGAEIFLGLREGAGKEDLRAALAAGTKEAVEAVLRRVTVRAGDLFDITPGTLHALGPGLVLLEVQQPVDLTYRVFDWQRVGLDGKPRELHVEQSLAVLDENSRPSALAPLAPLAGIPGQRLLHNDKFRLERWFIHGHERIPVTELLGVVCLGGAGDAQVPPGPGIWLERGRSFVVPRGVSFLDLRGESLDLAVALPPL
ncbi:MAG TPA: class I mannose-6-phosphate isomerase [Planctomycetota bacterium]|nr:class I mannose-6-phosphate isomerase [Planctomycetota bacterium]